MSAQFYVWRARDDLIPLRSQLHELGAPQDPLERIDVELVADVVGNCELLYVSALSEQRALEALRDYYNVDICAVESSHTSLAGALCVATTGLKRWIVVNADDSRERQRFTIAHELGHLFVEAIPELKKARSGFTAMLVEPPGTEVVLFSRCATTESSSSQAPKRVALSDADKREIRAHHFASELLMPYDGVKTLLKQASPTGIRSTAQLERLVREIAIRYGVSMAAARQRLEKDLAVVPVESSANTDLFM